MFGQSNSDSLPAYIKPNNQNITVTPTVTQQVFTADQDHTGLGTVTVNAVTSSIDNNITSENIKKDVTILGVTGDYEGSGGGDEIEVINWSGNVLNVGDKVWISPMYLGTEADFRQISTDTYPYSPTVHVSRDGTTVYYTFNGILYNTTTDTSITVNSINQSTSTGYSCVNYSRCGDVIYSVVDDNWVVEGSGIGVSTNYAFLGNNYYYNYNTNKYVKMIDNTKIEDKEYTLNNIVFYTSYGYGPYTFSVAKNYLYYCGRDGSLERISKAYIDDENLTITYVSELFNTTKRIPWTTYDENYVFVGNCGRDYGNRRWYNLQIYKVENNGDLSEINVLEMCPDLTPFYNNATSFRYNYLDDILTVGTANSIATFKYSNGTFIKLSDYTFSSSMNNSCQISSSSDGKILAYKGNQYYTPYCVKLQGNSEYKVVTYNNVNISSSSFTGYVTKGGANGELVKIQTVLPEKINVSVTVNADDAEISGGIE